MIATLVLFALSVVIRALGTMIKDFTDNPWVQRSGLVACSIAVWVAMHAASVWSTIWPLGVLLVTILFLPKKQLKPPLTIALLDLAAVIMMAFMAVPRLGFLAMFPLIAMVPAGGWLIDQLVEFFPKKVRLLIPAGVVLGLLLAAAVTPSTLLGGVRLLQTRFLIVGTSSPFASGPKETLLGRSPVPAVSAAELNEGNIAPGDVYLPIVKQPLFGLNPEEIVVARPVDIAFNNPSFSGNPFDLVATVTFTHQGSSAMHVTEMFYMGGNEWRVRFAPTQAGRWGYQTSSSDADLDQKSGSLDITQQTGHLGFIGANGPHWTRQGDPNQVFVPQFVMYADPPHFYNNPTKIENDIENFLDQHGFSGLHVKVFCRWYDLEKASCNDINLSSPDPDLRTFEALEQLITAVYAEGGVVHIWAWGDETRGQTPARWGYNGVEDQRLQRYIAARLGPLPGWTMGYGFDLFEWTTEDQLDTWYSYMHAHLGWNHLLGARSSKNQLDQLSELMDYSSYEQHRPTYEKYVETIERRPGKPSFSEDRFRIRDEGRDKDYSLDDTRRGLWRSGMAGGVANIWGYLLEGGSDELGSASYPNKAEIKRYFTYFDSRFSADLARCNELADAYCLKRPTNQHYIFYAEDSTSMRVDLSEMNGPQPYLIINTVNGEESRGTLDPKLQTITMLGGSQTVPAKSDWAMFVGSFEEAEAAQAVIKDQIAARELLGPNSTCLEGSH